MALSDSVIIRHNGGGLFHVGIPAGRTDPNGVPQVDRFTLFPGITVVDSAQWALAEKDSIVQYHLKHPRKNPMFEVVKAGIKAGEYPLKDMSVADAVERVEELCVRATLLEWQGVEKRGTVLAAITDQLKKIAPTGMAGQP